MNANVLVMKKGKFPFFSERKTSREHSRLTFTQTYLLSLFLIGLFGIYYVWILNVNATKGYNVRNLEMTRHNLSFEKSLLDIKIAEAQSLSTIANNPTVSAMEAVDNPSYLVLKDVHFTFNK